jgi:rhodanese-related sulfurtransferase
MKKSVIIALLLLIVLPITLSGCDYITGKALGPTKSIPPRWVWSLAGENAPPTIIDRYSHELITDVSPEEAFGIIGTSQLMNNPVVIDVRTPQEYTAGHIWNARNIDYSATSFESIINQYDKNYTIIVYCQSGYRSNLSRKKMEELGFRYVINMTGGFSTWVAAGLPVEK